MSTIRLDSGEKYTVSKIVCLGRNYAKHISEMAAQRTKDPVLFLKPPSSILQEGNPIVLPPYSSDVHYEVELALLVSHRATHIQKAKWRSYIGAIGIALDLTLRDLQHEAKKNGLPWSVSKGFDGSCPVSTFITLKKNVNPQDLVLKLEVNGEIRQHASTKDMIFPIDELISYISRIFTLEVGDLILTGTPEGVGPLTYGDQINAEIENYLKVEFHVLS
jgi:2-keto-4-pentenoate hydratase/2-oxohepta-3-ene-1,7-dioic acid hydratase in catechol pathway